MSRYVSLDYETFYIKPSAGDEGYSVKTLGNWRYCHDDRFDPYFLTVFDGSETWAGNPKNFNWAALEGCHLLAHNAGFEIAVTDRLIELGVAPAHLSQNKWTCTANMTSCLAQTRALANALRVLDGIRVSKDVREQMNKKNWADICATPGLEKQVIEYAIRDTRECFGLFERHGSRWSDFERQLSDLTIKQCRRGVAINVPLLKQYKGLLQEIIFNLVDSFPWTAAGGKPTSPKAIAEECRKVGIPAPPLKTKDEEGFDVWEATYGPKYPWAYGAGQWRSLNKLLGSLETVQERLRPDNTIDFSLLYFGGHTGRWSGGGSGFNLQNLRKEPLWVKNGCMVSAPAEVSADKAAFKAWRGTLDHELDVRALLIPRPGKKFIISDLSQVEPRVLNWLAGNQRLLDKIRDGFSYYEAYVALYKPWKIEPGTIKKVLSDKAYTLLKNEALGLGYQMGPDRYVSYVAANGGGVITAEDAQTTVQAFRENNPLVVALWASLNDGLRQSSGKDFEVELPSGRKMTYRNVLREVRSKKNKETGKFEKRFVWTAQIGNDRYEFYGGAIAENITQATARDVFGTHLLALEEQLGDVIFSVHDEAIVEADLDVSPREAERIMSVTPDWLTGCPLTSEAKEAMRYGK